MKPSTNKKTNSKDKKVFQLIFWIPYALIILLSGLFLLANDNSVIGWAIFVIVAIIVVSLKRFILLMKPIFKILCWIFLIVLLGFNSLFTNPFPLNRPLYSMEGRIATDAVKTQNGLVSGFYNKDKTVREFTGIPYAAPPVGELRWKSPQPAKSWDGVRQLDHFSDAAMQSKSLPVFSKFLGLTLGTDELLRNSSIKYNEKVSEDCLYLNVWSGAKSSSERLPVIVYIHGGSFVYGSGSMDVYNGENMAKKGVVFVNLNYRLGIFGFMANPELTKESEYNSSGNYGILDQIAALKWIKNNISEFGGDPDNVTIAGESAGAGSVNILMASPLAKGLFHRAIGESGAFFSAESKESGGNPEQKLSEAEKAGIEFQKSLKKTSIADMREMSAEDLVKASKNQTIVPNIDGYVLPDTVYNIFEDGKQNDVPIIVGSNSDEGSLLNLPWPANATVSADEFKSIVEKRYGSLADDLLKFYPADSKSKAIESQVKISTDQLFTWQMNTWAKLQSKTGKSKAYYYYFDKVQPGPSRFMELGAYHSAEIAYAYNNLDKIKLPYTDVDENLSDIMSSYWVNFATTGNPNGKNLPIWSEYDEKNSQAMRLGDKIEMIKTPNKAALELFDIHEENLRSK